MYELFTASVPFSETDTHGLSDLIKSGKRPSMDAGEGVPPDVRELVEACWRQDPQRRPEFKSIVVGGGSLRESGAEALPVKYEEAYAVPDRPFMPSKTVYTGVCAYSSANGTCRRITTSELYCSVHTCPIPGCGNKKASQEQMCEDHRHAEQTGHQHRTDAVGEYHRKEEADKKQQTYQPQKREMGMGDASAMREGVVLQVVGAGEDRVNGYYKINGLVNGKPRYLKVHVLTGLACNMFCFVLTPDGTRLTLTAMKPTRRQRFVSLVVGF